MQNQSEGMGGRLDDLGGQPEGLADQISPGGLGGLMFHILIAMVTPSFLWGFQMNSAI